MLEFQYSYRDPTYHKVDDPPWAFPPQNISNKFDSNIIEIQGKNGSGKSTLLNIIALAFGYLKYENELTQKDILKEKLRHLDDFDDMKYMVAASSSDVQPIKVEVVKNEGEKPRIKINNKNVSPEELRKFEVIFLTEDDPRKVATVSIGKISNFLARLEKRVNDTSGKILQLNSLVKSFTTSKKDEKDTIERMGKQESTIKQLDVDIQKLKELKSDLDIRDKLKIDFDLVKDEEKIVEYYSQLKKEVGKLEGKDIDKIYGDIIRLEKRVNGDNSRLKNTVEPSIRELSMRFTSFDIDMNVNELLNGDIKQITDLKRTERRREDKYEEYQLKLVKDLIKTLGRHPQDLTVPIADRSVSSMLQGLSRIRDRLSSGSLNDLIASLEKQLKSREGLLKKIESNEKKIVKLEKDLEGFDDYKTIKKEFDKIETQYLALKKLGNEEKIAVIEEYEKYKSVTGDSSELESEIRSLEIKKSVEEQTVSRLNSRLNNIRENMIKKPKYADEEDLLVSKYDVLFKLARKIRKWMTIIENPQLSKIQFTDDRKSGDFDLSLYNKFIKCFGEYLGNMFEPVTFSDMQHSIKFYDIELERFTTGENRHIYIRDLSAGQNKITALETSLRNLNPNRKGIVFVDEIADLDNENMGRVNTILNDNFKNGLILFAILVRPLMESNHNSVRILEW